MSNKGLNLLVTGGCGFIGSNFIRLLLEEREGIRILNIDKKTYAAQGNNIEHMELSDDQRYRECALDICERGRIRDVFERHKPDAVVHFAAESHVDRSIEDSSVFTRSNVLGTHNLLETALKHRIRLFLQISTDEVYGSLSVDDKPSIEQDKLSPRSPYSASKAAAEHLAFAFYHTHQLPIVITRSSNNYGPYQHPEKLIPLFTTNLIDGQKVPLMWSKDNPGLNRRDWIHVEDNCRGIIKVLEHSLEQGSKGEVYNIGGENERANIEITRELLKRFGFGEEMIKAIPHRLGHDFRYSLDTRKIRSLGWEPKYDFERGLIQTVEWYKANENWWRQLKK